MSIISKLVHKLLTWLKLKAKDVDPDIKRVLDVVLPAIAKIKEVLDSGVAKAYVSSTPYAWDDLVREFGVDICYWVLSQFNYESISTFVIETAALSSATRNALCMKMASKFVERTNGIPEYVADAASQLVFTAQFKNAA